MMHLFGVMHTQMRADRDRYITVHKNNIIPYFRREYDVWHLNIFLNPHPHLISDLQGVQ